MGQAKHTVKIVKRPGDHPVAPIGAGRSGICRRRNLTGTTKAYFTNFIAKNFSSPLSNLFAEEVGPVDSCR